MATQHSNYLKRVFASPSALQRTVDSVCIVVKEKGLKFSAVAGTGVSGVTVAACVAYRLRKQLIVLRRVNGDSTHASESIEGKPNRPFKYILLDDLIASGDTLTQAVTRMHQLPEAIILYDSSYRGRKWFTMYDDKGVPESHIPLYYTTRRR